MEKADRVKISKNVARVKIGGWHWYFRLANSMPKITGKYLFFSQDKRELEKLVLHELEEGDFFAGKINTDENKIGEDYVLCLYHVDDSRGSELAKKYEKNPKVKYRYWKSDEATRRGEYSEEFLKKLSPHEREE